jgi:hypothetical protein
MTMRRLQPRTLSAAVKPYHAPADHPVMARSERLAHRIPQPQSRSVLFGSHVSILCERTGSGGRIARRTRSQAHNLLLGTHEEHKTMAQRVQVVLTDDLDGREAAETVSFALDGTSYEIDLSAKNATKLRTALEPFVAAARGGETANRVTTSPRRGRAVQGGSPVSNQAVRAWARAHRIPVSPRGRIPGDVVERFRRGRQLSRFSPQGLPVRTADGRSRVEDTDVEHGGADSKRTAGP